MFSPYGVALSQIPLYSKLGPMLRTVTRMMGEVFAFVPLYVAVTLGFATALFVGIGHEVNHR